MEKDIARRGGAGEPIPFPAGRDLPHDLAAEQAVLGAILIEEAAFDQVSALLQAEDFYLRSHQLVFQACVQLAGEAKAIDWVLVRQRLEAQGLLGSAVPPELPFALSRGLGTAGNVGHYAGVEEIWFRSVEDLAKLRKNPGLYQTLKASYDTFVAGDDTFSMVTTERVIYDFITPGHLSPKASVLVPGTLEHQVDKQGYKGWNVPGWDQGLY